MTKLKDTILAHIQNGTLTMKPKWQTVLIGLLYLCGIVLVTLVSIYLLSFVLFTLRETGLWWMPGFGGMGLVFFITHSPWLLISVTLLFLLILYVLVRHYGHNYRQRTIYVLIGTVLIAILGGAILDYLAVHDHMRRMVDQERLPGLAPLYRHPSENRPRDITPGRIMIISEEAITIENPDGRYLVDISTARIPQRYTPHIGDQVMVFGPVTSSSTISARGLRPLPPPLERQLEKHREDKRK